MDISFMNVHAMKIIILIYLVIASYKDIKTYTLSLKLSLFFLSIILAIHLISQVFATEEIIYGLIPGTGLLLLARVTHESIGYGDGILIMVLGVGLGFRDIFIICSIAFLLSAVVAIFIMTISAIASRKKTRRSTLPFIPFILGSYLIHLALL